MNSFALLPLPGAEFDRPIHACDAAVAHVLRGLQLQHEHLNSQQCNGPSGPGQKLIAQQSALNTVLIIQERVHLQVAIAANHVLISAPHTEHESTRHKA